MLLAECMLLSDSETIQFLASINPIQSGTFQTIYDTSESGVCGLKSPPNVNTLAFVCKIK